MIAARRFCENQVMPVVFIVAAPKSIQAPVPFAAIVAKPFEARALRSAIGDALVLAREHRAARMIG